MITIGIILILVSVANTCFLLDIEHRLTKKGLL